MDPPAFPTMPGWLLAAVGAFLVEGPQEDDQADDDWEADVRPVGEQEARFAFQGFGGAAAHVSGSEQDGDGFDQGDADEGDSAPDHCLHVLSFVRGWVGSWLG